MHMIHCSDQYVRTLNRYSMWNLKYAEKQETWNNAFQWKMKLEMFHDTFKPHWHILVHARKYMLIIQAETFKAPFHIKEH